jgi:hypothetical protein
MRGLAFWPFAALLDSASAEKNAGFVRVIAPSRPLGMSLILRNGVRLEWQGDLGP